jgi:hypothetical protein
MNGSRYTEVFGYTRHKKEYKREGMELSAQLYHPDLQVLSKFNSPLLNHVPQLCPFLDSSSAKWACTVRGHDMRPDIIIITYRIMAPTLAPVLPYHPTFSCTLHSCQALTLISRQLYR